MHKCVDRYAHFVETSDGTRISNFVSFNFVHTEYHNIVTISSPLPWFRLDHKTYYVKPVHGALMNVINTMMSLDL